jgi:hypothetical protein
LDLFHYTFSKFLILLDFINLSMFSKEYK